MTEAVENKPSQATRKELAEGAREHYSKVWKLYGEWYSLIDHAIDAWEIQPELISKIADLKEQFEKADGDRKHLAMGRDLLKDQIKDLQSHVADLKRLVVEKDKLLRKLSFDGSFRDDEITYNARKIVEEALALTPKDMDNVRLVQEEIIKLCRELMKEAYSDEHLRNGDIRGMNRAMDNIGTALNKLDEVRKK